MSKLYNENFYDKQSSDSYSSALVTLQVLFDTIKFPINSIADFGCGVGPWLAAAKQLGVNRIYGTDGNYVPRDRLLIPDDNFFPNDLSKPETIVLPFEKFDLAISLEVAEHLPSSVAKQFIKKLCNSADIILFSAAIPYQGGHGHINENWQKYWAKFFDDYGFSPFDIIRPSIWNNENICWWYKQNTLVYINKKAYRTILPKLEPTPTSQLSIIHPEQYLVSVHRNNTSIKRGLRQDINYLKNTGEMNSPLNLNYGPEFSYIEKKNVSIESLAEICHIDKYTHLPVIKDALSSIKYRKINLSDTLSGQSTLGRAPDFICIGVQKSATTWLYNLFNNNPDTWVPPIKEINFFNSLFFDRDSAYSGYWRRDTSLKRLSQALINNKDIQDSWINLLVHLTRDKIDINWYKLLFSFAPNNKLTGEITPEYAMLPIEAIKYIYSLNPNLKIILLLRSPINRAISHIKMIKSNEPALSNSCLHEILNTASVFERGNYPKIIDNWLSVFPTENIYIDFQENIKNHPIDFCSNLESFLNCKIKLNEISNKVIHSSKVELYDEYNFILFLKNQFKSIIEEMNIRYPETISLWD